MTVCLLVWFKLRLIKIYDDKVIRLLSNNSNIYFSTPTSNLLHKVNNTNTNFVF